jgi:hypothetical protein
MTVRSIQGPDSAPVAPVATAVTTRVIAAIASVAALLATFGAAAAAAQEMPRTAWGDPDLEGTYTSDNSIGVPFERPERFGTRALLTDEEYAARIVANEVQVAKDLSPEPESEFSADDPAAKAASRAPCPHRP